MGVMAGRAGAHSVPAPKVFADWGGRLSNGIRYGVFHEVRRGLGASMETRLISVKADGGNPFDLLASGPNSFGMGHKLREAQIQDRVVDWLPGDGRHILLQVAEGDTTLPSVYKVNVETGRRQLVRGIESDVYQWIADGRHTVRVGVRQRDGKFEVIACNPDGSNWRSLWAYSEMADAVRPLGFGADPQELFVTANHQGRAAVFSVRLDRPDLPRQLRLAHPRFDVSGELMHSPATGEVMGLRGIVGEGESGEPRSELWEPRWRALAQAIDRGLPGRANRLLEISRDENRYLVYSSGNGQPAQYLLGDRRTGELALLADTYPALDSAELVGKHPVKIKARDGLELNAYLSLPAGRRVADGGTPLPLVLLPHGGPHRRDDDDFDPWTEFLAHRGYAVLQVNFRGSEGYGYAFEAAGLLRWDLEMQDDLTDAVRWAVARKVADAGRVCIVGASYGGYAALMGVVKTPEIYRCAVSFAGVSHLQDPIRFMRDYVGGRAAAEMMLGDFWGDRERLRATSPALQVERIQAPVLLVHGTADRVVPMDQSAGMAKALRRAGKRHRYIEQDGGDHHLSRNEHRLQFFQAMEAFLNEHLMEAPR